MAQRLDLNRIRITGSLEIILFANEHVFVDGKSINEIVEFSRVSDTIADLRHHGFFGDVDACIDRIVLTPDFHRGAGIPVGTVFEANGFVLPRAVGSDINCGMHLLVTDVTADEFARLDSNLDAILRHIFFEGARAIPLSAEQRRAIFRDGLPGLYAQKHSDVGIWQHWNAVAQEANLMRTHRLGQLPTTSIFNLEDFIKGSGGAFTYDDQIGSIGQGNHFVEMQRVDELYDHITARAWGLKPNAVTIMVHSGSVGIGHIVGKHFSDMAKTLFPTALKHPSHGFYMLPTSGTHAALARAYLSAMGNAANFAFANRLFLGLMAIRVLHEALGRPVESRLVYDAPHNLIWSRDEHHHIHRKGACPADGPDDDPEFASGHPVIIPGSMGSSSFVLRGHGNVASLCSACHGAGRMAPRQTIRRKEKGKELDALRVVSQVDPRMLREDIKTEYRKNLAEEAPSAYKEITPVIDTIVGADIASKVCRLWPLLTIKDI